MFCYFAHWENCSHLLLAKIHWSPISNHVQVPDHQVILLAINHESAWFKPGNPKGNQPWLFIGRTVAAAEPSIFRPPDAKSQVIGKDPDARKDWGKMRNGQQKMRWLDSLTNLMNVNLTKIQETVDRGAWCATVHGVTKSKTQLSDWTLPNYLDRNLVIFHSLESTISDPDSFLIRWLLPFKSWYLPFYILPVITPQP